MGSNYTLYIFQGFLVILPFELFFYITFQLGYKILIIRSMLNDTDLICLVYVFNYAGVTAVNTYNELAYWPQHTTNQINVIVRDVKSMGSPLVQK